MVDDLVEQRHDIHEVSPSGHYNSMQKLYRMRISPCEAC